MNSTEIRPRAGRTQLCGWAAALVSSLLVVALSPAPDARATPVSTAHSNIELIADRSSIAPGQRFWLGLNFQLEKGWHIYWVNPGDSGEPPRVQCELPAGFRAGPLEWPYPARLGLGTVMNYGYEHHVILLIGVRPPQNAPPGGTASFGANVKFLVCSEICIPAQAQLTLSLPVRSAPDPSSKWEGAFREARERLPREAPANWNIRAISRKDTIVLTVETGAREKQADFFPLDPQQIENSAPQAVTPLARGVRLVVRKSDQLLKPLKTLRGVLVLGPGRAFQIVAPVTESE